MRKTRKIPAQFEVTDPEKEELCTHCGGRGENYTRGYQMSLDEGWYVRCTTCNGSGVRPVGTKAAEQAAADAKYRARLLKNQKEIESKLKDLDLNRKEY